MSQLAESIEPRRLLSAALSSNGELTVLGPTTDAVIQVWNSGQRPSRLIVNDGVEQFSFPRASIRRIRILGREGNDRIEALVVSGPVDIPMVISAGPGNDEIFGGAANDTIVGGPGDDLIHGGAGKDWVDYRQVATTFDFGPNHKPYGAPLSIDDLKNDVTADGTDNIFGDVEGIFGTQFRDLLSGNGKNNTLIGGNGPDELIGAGGDDFLEGDQQTNYLAGGSGNDTLLGGPGANLLTGDAGDDDLRAGSGGSTMQGGSGNDMYRGGTGIDTVVFAVDAAVRTTFDGVANDGPVGSSDNFIEFDNLLTSGDGDSIDATGLPHGFHYEAGGRSTTVRGSEFDDTLVSVGDATIFGNGGNDNIGVAISGNNGIGTIDGGIGNDTILTGIGDDRISGAAGDDSITAAAGNDAIDGGSGRDTIRAGLGNDFVRGGKGSDKIAGEEGADTLRGEGSSDRLYGGADGDNFLASENAAGFVRDFEQGVDVLV